MVEAGLQEGIEIRLVSQLETIRQQAGDLSVLLGMGDQLGQVVAQGCFTAREDDVGDALVPGLVDDGLPFGGIQFAVDALGGGQGWVGAHRQAVGQCAVEAQGGVQILGVGRNPFEVQVRNRVQVGDIDQCVDALAEIQEILQGTRLVDAISGCDRPGSFFGSSPFHQVEGIFRRAGVQMQDRSGVDDQDAGAILAQAQVQAVGRFIRRGLVMQGLGREGLLPGGFFSQDPEQDNRHQQEH